MKKKDMKVKVDGMDASILYRMDLRPALVSVSTRSHLCREEDPLGFQHCRLLFHCACLN